MRTRLIYHAVREFEYNSTTEEGSMSPFKDASVEFDELINNNGGVISFEKVKEFAWRKDLCYRWGEDLIDIINSYRDSGKLRIDHEADVLRRLD